MAPYWKIAIAQLFCMVYILVLTFADWPVGLAHPVSKDIVDMDSVENTERGVIYLNGVDRPVVAIGGESLLCLGVHGSKFQWAGLRPIFENPSAATENLLHKL